MNESIMLAPEVLEILACPVCKAPVRLEPDNQLHCTDHRCGAYYPVVNGIPILINEKNSIFRLADFTSSKLTTYADKSNRPPLRKRLAQFLPHANQNLKAARNFREFARLLQGKNHRAMVLVIGGRVVGNGLDPVFGQHNLHFIETDVSIGPRTKIICDAHDLPFQNESLDGVVIQAVLEHVVDPYRCVAEIYRTLQNDGLVYAETPFMQQVHEGAYDVTRFTHLGHRRLFRHFSEINSGAVGGPGMALSWSYRYFLLSMFKAPLLRYAASAFARLTSFWLRFVDPLLIDKPGTVNSRAIMVLAHIP